MRIYQKDKLVMNVSGDPEKIRVVDRLNMFVVRTKSFKTKSDAMCYLLNTAMDLLEERDEEEKEDMTKKELEKEINPPPAAATAAVSK